MADTFQILNNKSGTTTTRSRSAANHFKNKIVAKNKSIDNHQKFKTNYREVDDFKINKTAFKRK